LRPPTIFASMTCLRIEPSCGVLLGADSITGCSPASAGGLYLGGRTSASLEGLPLPAPSACDRKGLLLRRLPQRLPWASYRYRYGFRAEVAPSFAAAAKRRIGMPRTPPRAVGAAPPRRGGGTRAVHRGRARRGARATPRPASAHGPRRSARVRDGMVGGTEWPGGGQRRAVTSEASDAGEARGLEGLGEGHRRQDGGEPPGQHGLAPRRPREESIQTLPLSGRDFARRGDRGDEYSALACSFYVQAVD
jgi:hypothetical protein